MKNKQLEISFLLLILCFGVMQIFGQEATRSIGTISVEIKSNLKGNKTLYFDVPVYQKIQDSILRGSEGFSFERTERTCDLIFSSRAVEVNPENALVSFYVGTQDSTKTHSVIKKIKLKKGERKSFTLKPKLNCSGIKYYSITAVY